MAAAISVLLMNVSSQNPSVVRGAWQHHARRPWVQAEPSPVSPMVPIVTVRLKPPGPLLPCRPLLLPRNQGLRLAQNPEPGVCRKASSSALDTRPKAALRWGKRPNWAITSRGVPRQPPWPANFIGAGHPTPQIYSVIGLRGSPGLLYN